MYVRTYIRISDEYDDIHIKFVYIAVYVVCTYYNNLKFKK